MGHWDKFLKCKQKMQANWGAEWWFSVVDIAGYAALIERCDEDQ